MSNTFGQSSRSFVEAIAVLKNKVDLRRAEESFPSESSRVTNSIATRTWRAVESYGDGVRNACPCMVENHMVPYSGESSGTRRGWWRDCCQAMCQDRR